MAHDDGLDVLYRIASCFNLSIEAILGNILFSRRDIVHRTPMLLHVIVAARLEKDQASSSMLDENAIHYHLYPFVLRLWIARRARIIMAACE